MEIKQRRQNFMLPKRNTHIEKKQKGFNSQNSFSQHSKHKPRIISASFKDEQTAFNSKQFPLKSKGKKDPTRQFKNFIRSIRELPVPKRSEKFNKTLKKSFMNSSMIKNSINRPKSSSYSRNDRKQFNNTSIQQVAQDLKHSNNKKKSKQSQNKQSKILFADKIFRLR